MYLRKNFKKSQGRRLDRINARKDFDYTPADSVSPDSSWSSSCSADSRASRAARSLDLTPSSSSPYFYNEKSIRIDGRGNGEIETLLSNLGLHSTEDFGISVTAWEEARKARSLVNPSRFSSQSCDSCVKEEQEGSEEKSRIGSRVLNGCNEEGVSNLSVRYPNHSNSRVSNVGDEARVRDLPVRYPPNDERSEDLYPARVFRDEQQISVSVKKGGINGVRPPILSTPDFPPLVLHNSNPSLNNKDEIRDFPIHLPPPPSISLPKFNEALSIEDLIKSLGPKEQDYNDSKIDLQERKEQQEEEEQEEQEEGEEDGEGCNGDFEEDLRLGETTDGFTGTSSISTINDDETSSTNTEAMCVVSPNGRFRRTIRSWMRGVLLGSGSFGMVYEGISDEGIFFAVKEVSLLDQGINAKQCITQLEQEIALLSQFEHENIVQYYGTDKEEAKLFIFLELVTQGSLASLYQKYNLRDSQVSAYTKQILNGLVYLHDRNVVHRDIKCANILVHVNGSVKLADFGLAKEITKINNLKSCKGSAYWMAPEVVNPKRTYGPAADIWSLGCTVLEMLTRELPYPNLEWTQALFQIGQGIPPTIPNNLSRDARDFINRCVGVNPFDRPTACQLLDHPFVNRSLQSTTPPSGSTTPSRRNINRY